MSDFEFKNSLLELKLFFNNLRTADKISYGLKYIEYYKLYPIINVVFNNQPIIYKKDTYCFERDIKDSFEDGSFFLTTEAGKKYSMAAQYFANNFILNQKQLLGYNVSSQIQEVNRNISPLFDFKPNEITFNKSLEYIKKNLESKLIKGILSGGMMLIYEHLQSIYCIVNFDTPLFFEQKEYAIIRTINYTLFDLYRDYPNLYSDGIMFLNSPIGQFYTEVISYFAHHYIV